MKLLSATFFVGILASLLSCNAVVHDRLITGKIVRDCTGTYVQVAGQGDYLVCNNEILKDKKDDSQVSVVYDNVDKCPEKEGVAMCMMYHESKGKIKVKSVK